MAVSSRAVVELVLLGPTHDRRQLQDTPILGDVWAAFAARPAAAIDLLISPHRKYPAGPVAKKLADRLAKLGMPHTPDNEAHVAYLQGIVAARLFFAELVRVVVPMTGWWKEKRIVDQLESYSKDSLVTVINELLEWARAKSADAQGKLAARFGRFTALERYVALGGLILWAAEKPSRADKGIGDALDELTKGDDVFRALAEVFDRIRDDPAVEDPLIWQVSLNRKAMPALERSVPAVKGDAAKALFKVKCDEITWAVLDSGIDVTHPAFAGDDGRSRVVKAFDFTNIREVVSLDNLEKTRAEERVARLLKKEAPSDKELAAASQDLLMLAKDAENDRPINWGLVAKFVEIPDPAATPPSGGHGTHVAGIIGARKKLKDPANAAAPADYHDGMCSDIRLYDFRVLARTLDDTEFAIIAALQYIRYLNERNTYISVHGANLSLSIPHDVRNFACGRTPVCNECERLIDSGVVVVAAAGNLGYHSFETRDGSYEGYMAFSITDPGNADGVITVGATHRFWPHTYGVSFFSSRGPTGDGRMRPDLVAPGERIESCLPMQGWGELDGTSMAAPHVSGAAAMLMGRYSELIGQPRRIKRLLCESATDLGRDRSFQGHGMLDVLRAFQKM
jgi:hypothetical protein